MPTTVSMPPYLDPVFRQAEEAVARFFRHQRQEPSQGTIDIFGERHGGKVWVESKVGQGSTFWFTLPRAAAPEPSDGVGRGERVS